MLPIPGRTSSTFLEDKWTEQVGCRNRVPLGSGKPAIYRHSVAAIGKDQVVLFGGRRVGGITIGEWLRYDRSSNGWDTLDCHDAGPALWGASICWRNGVGVLVGGMTLEGECTGDVYTWRREGTTVKLKNWNLNSHSRTLDSRYGAKIIPYGEGDFLLVGGAGSHHVLTWTEQFLLLAPATESIHRVEIPIVAGVEPWLVGHDVAVHETTGEIVIVGGGGVCFSFGSFWNEKILHLSNPPSTTSIKSLTLRRRPWIRIQTNLYGKDRTPPKQIRRVRINTLHEWHEQVIESQKSGFGAFTSETVSKVDARISQILRRRQTHCYSFNHGTRNEFSPVEFPVTPHDPLDTLLRLYSAVTTRKSVSTSSLYDAKTNPRGWKMTSQRWHPTLKFLLLLEEKEVLKRRFSQQY